MAKKSGRRMLAEKMSRYSPAQSGGVHFESTRGENKRRKQILARNRRNHIFRVPTIGGDFGA